MNAYCNPDQDSGRFWYESVHVENLNIPMFAGRSHDRSLTDDVQLTDVVNVVQFREPERQIVSYLRRMELADPGCISRIERKRLTKMLAANAAYLVLFCEKWLRGQSSDDVVVKYSDLVQHPARVIRTVLLRTGHDYDPCVFEATNQSVAACTIENKQLRAYAGPNDEVFTLVDPVRLATFSDYVRSRTQWMEWSPVVSLAADCEPADRHAFATIADAIHARLGPQ